MTLENLLQHVRRLSDSEKLALIQSTAHMLQQSHFTDDSLIGEDSSVVNLTEQSHHMVEIIEKLMSRPDPVPGQMMKRGIFKGVTIDESDFKAAEWHPHDDELDNGGTSLHH